MSFTKDKVFIIAEAGVNHNGELALAKQLVEAAARAGADAVKFQTFKAENIVAASAPKADYQKKNTGNNESQLEMLKKLELAAADFIALKTHCAEHGILFMSTPFDLESIDFLAGLGLEIFKIPSGELTNLPYLRKLGSLRKNLILSTGMADLAEVQAAVAALLMAGTEQEQLAVLHCNTEYPTPYQDVNLRAMETLRSALHLRVGYSDHTLGIEVPVAAVALGATIIEKHFTLDKTMRGPDHRASLEPGELKQMVQSIRHIEIALGREEKKTTPSELHNRNIARKSIVAAQAISKGEMLSEHNLTVKRPGTGISPMLWDQVIGKPARQDFVKDQMIVL
ncbi:MAG: N-acetylneuraminate synthase [Proteobacteria bacterium]|nr:N-acetylneuraminate synthase [Pseudomonadota bacterium]